MYVGLQSWLETDPSLRERAQMHRSSQNGLKSLVRCSATDDPVATLLGKKIKGGSTTGSPSSVSQQSRQRTTRRRNALREPVVLRKIIGTLRNDRGMFVHETLLSLLATSRQQGRNPYEKLKRIVRDNEMISRTHAVPSVESSG